MVDAEDGIHILLVERDWSVASLIIDMLRTTWDSGLVITHAERLDDVGPHLTGGVVSVVLLGAGNGQPSLLEQVGIVAPGVPVIVLRNEYSREDAVLALSAGAQDYLTTSQLTSAALERAVVHALSRKRSEVALTQRALEDPLTGLPNRTLFVDRLRVALDRARRTGAVTAVLFLDVDHFKVINDSLGHAAGDQLLTALAGRLRSALRPMDTVARFGGDEFTFLFEDLSSVAEAMAIAERVQQAATAPIALPDGPRQLSVSLGIATSTGPGTQPDALIRDADLAMYESKRRGGGGTSVAEGPLAASAADRAQLSEELRGSLERGELHVVYQPRYDLEGSGRLEGFEALVRWEHPTRGTIRPRDFLPVAAEVGMLGRVGAFVIQQALALRARLNEAQSGLTVSINLSGEQLSEHELQAALSAVHAAGVDPRTVCAEIPERAVSADPDLAIRAARILHDAGLRVAIDDYGTGTVSISSLRQLGADELKIHESFVSELGNAAQSAVVRAVVELGHALGMTVIAEGVETEGQLGELRLLGCDGAQGYLLCRPLSADQLEQLVLPAR